MTIRVTVKNEDSAEERVILAQQTDLDGDAIPGMPSRELSGGQSAEFYVHYSNRIVVVEKTR